MRDVPQSAVLGAAGEYLVLSNLLRLKYQKSLLMHWEFY